MEKTFPTTSNGLCLDARDKQKKKFHGLSSSMSMSDPGRLNCDNSTMVNTQAEINEQKHGSHETSVFDLFHGQTVERAKGEGAIIRGSENCSTTQRRG